MVRIFSRSYEIKYVPPHYAISGWISHYIIYSMMSVCGHSFDKNFCTASRKFHLPSPHAHSDLNMNKWLVSHQLDQWHECPVVCVPMSTCLLVHLFSTGIQQTKTETRIKGIRAALHRRVGYRARGACTLYHTSTTIKFFLSRTYDTPI